MSARVSTSWLLDDFTADNGSTRIVPEGVSDDHLTLLAFGMVNGHSPM